MTRKTTIDISVTNPAVLEMAKQEHNKGYGNLLYEEEWDDLSDNSQADYLARSKVYLEHLIQLAFTPEEAEANN